MPTTHVQAGSSAQLQEIADSLWKAKKVVVVTGAGISTNSGIPDFRSENGLYSMIQSQFDAAAGLNGAKTRGNGVSSDDSGDELRPKKRRKLSLLDRDSTVEGDSIKVLGPDDSQVSHATEGGNHGGQAPINDTRPDPGEEEVDLLTEESVLAGEASFVEPGGQGESQSESSENPAPKSPKRSSDPRNASSSGSSTPKQTSSDSGAQTNTLSSPLSSPPPILSDPYEEAFHHSPTSSSRCTSPESASEADNSPPSSRPFNYSQTFKRASLSTMKGRDLFDASIWSDPVKTSVFYTFATNLRQKSREAYPTGSHHFISHLRDSGRMVRCYTQNIDLLEDKVGLSTRLLLGPGSRSRFSARASRAAAAAALATATAAPAAPAASCSAEGTGRPDPAAEPSQPSNEHHEEEKDGSTDTTQPLVTEGAKDQCQQGDTQTAPSSPEPDRGVECVYLHGSLRSLRCFQCGGVIDWDEGDREMQTMSGNQPPCPRCEDATTARQEKGKRALGVGKLRPDIVLYGEEHPESQRISDIIQHDLSLAPDLLIIMGTSLKVHGLKTVVKEFAKAIHNKKDGKVIFINYTKPADSVWADTIDFWVEMDCDAWVNDLKEKKPIIWSPPGTIADESRSTKRRRRTYKSSQPATKPAVPKPAPKRPVSEREHKDNGAYWTTRIMANLAFLTG
ncbi:DHS-like NAD/FAD-binding domain-containing protein, partial [Diaporthe sp. PMI_573]